jgi:hypothetical protein
MYARLPDGKLRGSPVNTKKLNDVTDEFKLDAKIPGQQAAQANWLTES